MTANITQLREPRSLRVVLAGYFRLSKVFVFQHYFGWALAWLLASPEAARRPGASASMVLFLLGSMGIVGCACAADDLVGFRNGSDAINYRSGHGERKIHTKPLLSGALSEGDVKAFIAFAGGVVIASGAAAFWALGWHAPVAAYLFYAIGGACSVQYSAGLRFSFHRGGAETLLCLATASGLLAPYLAIEQTWSMPAICVSLLLGLWMVLVSSYSNMNDVQGDRTVGRRTLATTVSLRSFRLMMAVLVLASIGLVCVLSLDAGWPWWTLLTMAPATALHLAQLHVGPALGRWLEARRLGLIAYNLGFLGIGAPAVYLVLSRA